MKSLLRWSAIVSLVGSSFIGPALAGKMQAFALPESEVMKRMEGVPFFAITNQQGIPILASLPNPQDKNKKLQVAAFFESQADAQQLVTRLQKSNPSVGKGAKVVPISLRQAYELAKKNESKKDELAFEFVPEKKDVDAALAVLKQNGKTVKQFNGVPLFYAADAKSQGFLTIEANKSKMIPFYFDQKDLQGMLQQLKQQNPKLAATTKIQVTSLGQVLDSMLKQDGEEVKQVTLIPSRAALEYVLAQQRANQKAAPAAKPAPKK